MEDAFKESEIAVVMGIRFAALLAVHLEHAPRRPRVDGRVHVAEGPLVSGELAVRVHIPFAREQHELMLGEAGIHERQRNGVERKIPRAYHGYSHLSGIEMMSALLRCIHSEFRPCLRSGGGGNWFASPLIHSRHVVVKELLRPDHPGERLSLEHCARRHR